MLEKTRVRIIVAVNAIHSRGEYPSHVKLSQEMGWISNTGMPARYNKVRLARMKELGIKLQRGTADGPMLRVYEEGT